MACRRAGTGPGAGDDAAAVRRSRVTGRSQGRARVQGGWDRCNVDRCALPAHGATWLAAAVGVDAARDVVAAQGSGWDSMTKTTRTVARSASASGGPHRFAMIARIHAPCIRRRTRPPDAAIARTNVSNAEALPP